MRRERAVAFPSLPECTSPFCSTSGVPTRIPTRMHTKANGTVDEARLTDRRGFLETLTELSSGPPFGIECGLSAWQGNCGRPKSHARQLFIYKDEQFEAAWNLSLLVSTAGRISNLMSNVAWLRRARL